MGSYVPSTGKEAADRRFRVSGRTRSINQRQFSWVPMYPTRAKSSRRPIPESVAARLRAVSNQPKMAESCQFLSETKTRISQLLLDEITPNFDTM